MTIIQRILIRQYGATAQMLQESMESCPEHVWTKESGGAAFWHLAYHTIFFLDFYLHKREADFTPAPFHRDNASYLGTAPSGEPYSKTTLLDYLRRVRKCAQPILAGLTDDDLIAPSPVPWYTIERGEFLLNNLRHAQHHIGQLNMMLRAHGAKPPEWRGTGEL